MREKKNNKRQLCFVEIMYKWHDNFGKLKDFKENVVRKNLSRLVKLDTYVFDKM